jgi:hypothetical protein
MVIGFEEETAELTDLEKKAAKLIALGLNARIGREAAITNAQIIKAMNKKGYDLNSARIRKIIRYIRIEHMVRNLIATSKGYYVSKDRQEITKYRQSLRERAQAILSLMDSFDQ